MGITNIQYTPSNKPIHITDGKFQFNTMSKEKRTYIFDIANNIITYQLNECDMNFANAFILYYFKQLDEKQYFQAFAEYIDTFDIIPAKDGIRYLQRIIEKEIGQTLMKTFFHSGVYGKYLYLQQTIIKLFFTSLFDVMYKKNAFYYLTKNIGAEEIIQADNL